MSPTDKSGTDQKERRIGAWLLATAALVYIMVLVGGITRLTRSGLSIVDWDPVVGTLPPLSEHRWEEIFAAYRDSPEFNLVNNGMTLSEFKSIFWWEYTHRLLGRVIGMVLLVPFGVMLYRRHLDRWVSTRIAGLIALLGLEGFLGWFMVASGLVHEPRVSQYRLAAHLLTATAILGATLWVAWDLLDGREVRQSLTMRLERQRGFGVVALVVMMLGSGALVAGTRAGNGFNTFPLMNGRLVPRDLLTMGPSWINFTENLVTVQFQHRVLAVVVAFTIPAFALARMRAHRSRRMAVAALGLVGVVAAQFVLGILTLVNHVPVALGSLHQGGGLLLFALTLFVVHQSRYSAGGETGVDGHDGAGHVAGVVGGEKDDHPRDLVGVGKPLHGDGLGG